MQVISHHKSVRDDWKELVAVSHGANLLEKFFAWIGRDTIEADDLKAEVDKFLQDQWPRIDDHLSRYPRIYSRVFPAMADKVRRNDIPGTTSLDILHAVETGKEFGVAFRMLIGNLIDKDEADIAFNHLDSLRDLVIPMIEREIARIRQLLAETEFDFLYQEDHGIAKVLIAQP